MAKSKKSGGMKAGQSGATKSVSEQMAIAQGRKSGGGKASKGSSAKSKKMAGGY